jgi:hypothetical protein
MNTPTQNSLQPITPQQHASLRWKRFAAYTFAAEDTVVPVVAHEVSRAAMALPLAFVQAPAKGWETAATTYVLMAVLGLGKGQNLFVAPDGRWLGAYTPAAYRGYPFQLANTPDGKQVLCLHSDSGLVSDTEGGTGGERFFDDDGQPSQALKEVLGFLTQVAQNRQATQRIVALLDEKGLIQPWSIKTQSQAGERAIEGLYRIDEAKLNELGGEDLKALQQAGALPLAYAQLLSMQHLQTLGKLAQARASQPEVLPTTGAGELDLAFLNKGGTISFGGV